jgi:hypothetical protein
MQITILDITLGLIALVSSTFFGYSVGRHAGFKEGFAHVSNLLERVSIKVGDNKNE